tara:strand:+ start:1801 stop:2088 length:288 start_codon:yes stop_codon:yes gene_type:complete
MIFDIAMIGDDPIGLTFACSLVNTNLKVVIIDKLPKKILVNPAYHSFGGWKKSLFGDQHMHGPEGVRFYTKLKTITSKWPSGLRSDPEFVMPTMR